MTQNEKMGSQFENSHGFHEHQQTMPSMFVDKERCMRNRWKYQSMLMNVRALKRE